MTRIFGFACLSCEDDEESLKMFTRIALPTVQNNFFALVAEKFNLFKTKQVYKPVLFEASGNLRLTVYLTI